MGASQSTPPPPAAGPEPALYDDELPTTVDDPLRALGMYHSISKHGVDKWAPGPSKMTYATAPATVRRFDGCPAIGLPLRSLQPEGLPTFSTAMCGAAPVRPLDVHGLSSLLYHSLALSGRKRTAHTSWDLRVSPSSGNLHPTEAYLLVGGALLQALRQRSGKRGEAAHAAAVMHYCPDEHALEERGVAADGTAWGDDSVVVVLSAVQWREAWKYGVRAWRYSVRAPLAFRAATSRHRPTVAELRPARPLCISRLYCPGAGRGARGRRPQPRRGRARLAVRGAAPP